MGFGSQSRPGFHLSHPGIMAQPACPRQLATAFVPVIVAVLVTACSGPRSVTTPDGGPPDTSQPTTCGFGVHVPEFDPQCKGGTGCRYIDLPPTCGCGCAACDGETCVQTKCVQPCTDGNSAPLDGGSDATGDTLRYSSDCAADGGRVVDAGPASPVSPPGPDYKLITTDAYVATAHGDNVVWSTPARRTSYDDIRDICYYSLQSGLTKCLCLDRNEYDVSQFVVERYTIAWVFRKHVPGSFFIGLDYLELDKLTHERVDAGKGKPIDRLAAFDQTVVYSVYENDLRKVVPFYKYQMATKAIEPLLNQGRTGGFCLYGDDLVYHSTVYKGKTGHYLFHYDLGTNAERLLNASNTDKLLCAGMWDRRLVYMDWTGKYGPGPDVVMYDLDSDKESEIDAKQYGQWFPSIYKNLVMWTDLSASKYVEGGPGQLWILDLDTNVRRQVTTVAGDYSAQVFSHKHFIVTTDTGSPGGVPYYLFDLEKAGIVKDGSVVPE
ncbi:MAG: hypothetical protein HY897_04850 [Deltaproteobacteria bacterium]|nr:hypothetical protein [Deltaproteobacteria bacterium]